MRALALPLSLAMAFASLPTQAQATRFLKVDVVDQTGKHHHQHKDGPTEVHIRVPLSLAKGVLETVAAQEIQIGGTIEIDGTPQKVNKTQKLKLDQLVKLLESCKPGDLLLQVDTNDGTHVKIAVE